MPNAILNASGLDGVAGYSGAGLAVDDEILGAPARVVITANGQLSTDDRELGANAGVYAFGHFAGSGISVRFKAAGAVVSTVALPVLQPPRNPRRGLAGTFGFAKGYVPAPAGATEWALVCPGGGPTALFRPFAMASSPTAPRPCWRPGAHLNPDLALPTWPELLPNPQTDGFELEPIPLRKSFAGDTGVPITRRMGSISRRFATISLLLDAEGRDRLDSFWRSNVPEFWFVRPDNGDLVIAEWTDDGDPKENGKPGQGRTSTRLLLREP